MSIGTNYGLCGVCRRSVPAEHVVREEKVYLKKICDSCGTNESLVSSSAKRWRKKREICHYDESQPISCGLECDSCDHEHEPRMVFIDVTNRCNMKCPICIANVSSMGFEFNSPLEYFDELFRDLSSIIPEQAAINLFGGEPTVRDDLFDIIELGRRHDLDIRIVTNGLRLADEDYCRRLCDARVPLLFAFDGLDPSIYERMRKNQGAYAKKRQALENLKKYSTKKHTIMCCIARNINDEHMRALIDFSHENRDFIKCVHLIPLTETWEEGEFEHDVSTTIEDAEEIIDRAFPEETVEFVPFGLQESLVPLMRFFGSAKFRWKGVHPNCESITYLVSDGNGYKPLAFYLKRPLDDIVEEICRLSKQLSPKLDSLDPDNKLDLALGRWHIARAFTRPLLRSLKLGAIFEDARPKTVPRIIGELLRGRSLQEVLSSHSSVKGLMYMVVLPFEEHHSLESARLKRCLSAFAYADPKSGEVRTIPACIWQEYKNPILRSIAEKYSSAPRRRAASS